MVIQLEDITAENIAEGKVYQALANDGQIVGFREVEVGNYIPLFSGLYFVSSKVTLADGTPLPALIGIDTDLAGEHYSTSILTDNGYVSEGDDSFLETLNRTHQQVFPYSIELFTPSNIPLQIIIHRIIHCRC